MTEKSAELIQRKHIRLLNISAFAEILSWTLLALYILQQIWAGLEGISDNNLDLAEVFNSAFTPFWINFVIQIFQAVMYFLILQAVAMGLKMIVETNVNYRENEMVVQDE